jgi:hypothetical protein
MSAVAEFPDLVTALFQQDSRQLSPKGCYNLLLCIAGAWKNIQVPSPLTSLPSSAPYLAPYRGPYLAPYRGPYLALYLALYRGLYLALYLGLYLGPYLAPI